jgi:hypothetical protein
MEIEPTADQIPHMAAQAAQHPSSLVKLGIVDYFYRFISSILMK